MRAVLIALPLIIGLLGIVCTVIVGGMLLPKHHTATVSAKFSQSSAVVFEAISNPAVYSTWRKDMTGFAEAMDADGRRVIIEKGAAMGKDLPLEVTLLEPPGDEADAPGKRVTTIRDETLPFGGTWTFEVKGNDREATLRITESGFVTPPAFRYLARVFGHDATMRGYLKQLGQHFGEKVRIES